MNIKIPTVIYPMVIFLLALCSCQSTSEPEAPAITSIEITPSVVVLTALGAAQQLTATVRDENGNVMEGIVVNWTSFAQNIATVTATGVVTSVRTGSAQILADASGVSATAEVTVSQEVASMRALSGDGQSAIAGSLVPVSPVVQLLDANSNLVSEKVVSFSILSGGGNVNVPMARSNVQGTATADGWTLGPLVGTNQLQASVDGVQPVTFTATGIPGSAAVMTITQGNGQSTEVGTPVPVAPAVRITDTNGNAVASATVTYSVISGAGSVIGPVVVSDDMGNASVGGWVLGPAAGANSLLASTSGAPPVTFTATGVGGQAAIVRAVAGDGQTGPTGTVLAIPPSVIVTTNGGQPVANQAVTFLVTAGGGTVTGGSTTTGPDGIATVGSWQLGPTAGVNTLTATVVGLQPVTFLATAVSVGGPASVSVVSGDGQTVLAGAPVILKPTVVVRDASGVPLSGVTVNFSVATGGGAITGAATVSDSLGQATVGSWTLGSVIGQHQLTASVPGLTPAVFSANGVGANYNIEIRHLDTPSAAVATAFANAEARWESLVASELVDINFTAAPLAADACGLTHPALADVIDDLMIWVRLEAIDGAGGVLGSAGPCITRNSPVSTVVGVMRFDTADLDQLAANGSLEAVILHEVGHVLGIGTLWESYGLLKNPSLPANPGADTHFDGAFAVAAFDQIGGTNYTGGLKVPVENAQGGAGTQDGHWRESVFDNELMTGFLNPGNNPLSLLTIGSLVDVSLIVNPGGADTFNGVFSIMSQRPTGNAIKLSNDIWRGPLFVVSQNGGLNRIR